MAFNGVKSKTEENTDVSNIFHICYPLLFHDAVFKLLLYSRMNQPYVYCISLRGPASRLTVTTGHQVEFPVRYSTPASVTHFICSINGVTCQSQFPHPLTCICSHRVSISALQTSSFSTLLSPRCHIMR